MPTNADRIVEMLQAAGVERLFGMPGGGSNADLIEAASNAKLPFSLAQTETGSAFMASAQSEITGKPGACLATLGPGAASLTNGVANASLDRVPLIVLTDCYSNAGIMQHQALLHQEIFRSLVKCTAQLSPEIDSSAVLQHILEVVSSDPPGPVHVDVSHDAASAASPKTVPLRCATNSKSSIQLLPEEIEQLIRRAHRPVFLIGLGARNQKVACALRTLSQSLKIPALVTYKAKGVVPDRHPWFAGIFLNGALEREVLQRADLFLAVGLDTVELLPVPWRFSQPVVSISEWPIKQRQIPFYGELVGDMVGLLDLVASCLAEKSAWNREEVLALAERQRQAMRIEGRGPGLSPHRVVELTAEVYSGARATVDAGAFMLPLMSLWPAEEPCGVLISNGLATMGFALPAAIGAGLLDTPKPTLAFTGDGGLLMCLGELRTAAREKLPLRVIVFDDGELSLIKIKQAKRGYSSDGVTIGATDWQAVGRGLGILAMDAADEASLHHVLRHTHGHDGPVLISAKVAADAYPDAIRVLRG